MKITAVGAITLSRLHEPERQWITAHLRIVKADAAIVVVKTDDGLVGIGEATPYGGPLLVKRAIDDLAETIVGQRVETIELDRPPFPGIPPQGFPHIRPLDAALAGLDTALWDLRAKAAGKPLAQLISPDVAPTIDVYASTGVRYDWRARPEALLADVEEAARLGHRVCKLRIGTHWAWDGITVDRFLGLLREVRQAAPETIAIAVDANARLDFDSALAVGRGLEALDCAWFEEPVPLDLAQYRELRARLDVPVTGGESLTTFKDLSGYIAGGAFDIVQPDVAVTGITDALKVAELAMEHGVEVCTHNWHNDLMTIANAHFMAAIGSARPLERCMVQGPLQAAVLAEPLAIEDGRLTLPQTPGLGVSLADGLQQAFPHIEGHYALEVVR